MSSMSDINEAANKLVSEMTSSQIVEEIKKVDIRIARLKKDEKLANNKIAALRTSFRSISHPDDRRVWSDVFHSAELSAINIGKIIYRELSLRHALYRRQRQQGGKISTRKPTRNVIIGGAIDEWSAKEKQANITFNSSQINKYKNNPEYVDRIKKWQDYINTNQPLLNAYNAEKEATDRAMKEAAERRSKFEAEEKLKTEGPTIRNTNGELEKAYVPPGWKPGDPVFAGWESPEKYYERFTTELKKIPGITDDLINKIVNYSQEASPYKVETQKNPNPKVKRTLSEIEFMNQPWATKWLSPKEKITLIVQAIQDPVVVHEKLGQIFDAVNTNRSPQGILYEQGDERIKQAISDEITDPGAIIKLRQQVWHEKYDPKGIEKVAQDFTNGLSKAIDYISPIVSFIPGIGPALSAGLDVANFGYQFYQGNRDAQDQSIDDRYIEEQNNLFSKYYEEVPEDDESEPQEEHHSDELEGGKIKSHLLARQQRQKRYRSIKPILSGTKRMEWLKRTVPLNQVPIT